MTYLLPLINEAVESNDLRDYNTNAVLLSQSCLILSLANLKTHFYVSLTELCDK